MNTTHDYTDEQLQAAIDAAFPAGARPEGFNLDNRPSSVDWKLEAPNRLAIARAFLAALPKPAEADPYARLKAYAAAGARIRCYYRDEGQVSFWGGWNVHGRWEWCQPVDQYEIHPDDLHLCPEYAPKAASPDEHLLSQALRALCLTRDYVGPAVLKAMPGWDWYDAGTAISDRIPNDEWAEQFRLRLKEPDEPATFEAHGKTWTRHMPGDPCPCDLRASVYVAFKDGTFSGRPGLAVNWAWGTYLPDSEWLIGWRYADEPAQAEAANTDKEWNEYQQELMNPLPKPWTPRPGDVVRLKSGGPVMTVEAPNKDSNTFCSWFDGNGINQRFFPAACLTPVKKLQS